MSVSKTNLFGFNINANKFNMQDEVYVIVPAEARGHVDMQKICKSIITGVKVNLRENPEEGVSDSTYSYKVLMDLSCTRFFNEEQIFNSFEEAEEEFYRLEAIYENGNEDKINMYKDILIQVEKSLEVEEMIEEPINDLKFGKDTVNQHIHNRNDEIYIYFGNEGLNNPNQIPVFKSTIEGVSGVVLSTGYEEDFKFDIHYIVLFEEEFETIHIPAENVFKHKVNALMKAQKEIRAKLVELGYNLNIKN